jgi:hypothetical protein
MAKQVYESPAETERMMEEICKQENCREALRRVKANKGSPGIDAVSVDDLPGYLVQHWPEIRAQLLSGTYRPQPVRRVEIPKPDGGMRKLGVPTVLDRLIQQAVLQVLQRRFEKVLQNYDVVLHSQDAAALKKSLRVLKPGGTLISISGPPDPAFAKGIGAPWFVTVIVRLLSSGVRKKATRRDLKYSFLFMRADGHQLREITRLVEAGFIRPVIDRVVPFESTNDALAYVEAGRAKGKVVVKVK